MKKIITLFACLLVSIISFAQVSLKSEYDGNEITMIDLANDGQKFLIKDYDAEKEIKIYNLDYSIFKSIEAIGNTLNISQNKINNDNKLEILAYTNTYNDETQTSLYTTVIYNEDLEIIFSLENYFPLEINDDNYIHTTTEGEHLIYLRKEGFGDKIRIYSLGEGELSSSQISLKSEEKKAYPNPSVEHVNIPYSALNNEIVTISIFDVNGSLITTKKVDDQFTELKLDITNYTSGVYLYIIKNSLGSYNGKFIKK